MSCLAKLSTFESTVSTTVALASTNDGAWRKADSNESYLMFTIIRVLGSGVMFSFASVITAKVPSDPVRIRDTSN